MRVSLLMWSLVAVCSSMAADGYKKQISFGDLQNENPRAGDVYKIRQFQVELREIEENRIEATIYSYRKEGEKTLKLVMNKAQSEKLALAAWSKLAGNLFIRKSSNGWDFMGTEIYRDQNGQTAFR